MNDPVRRVVREKPIEVIAPASGASPIASSWIASKDTAARFGSIAQKLADGTPLRVVMLNDAGFNGGAGIATGRQALSLMTNGHKVAMVCSFRNTPLRLRTRGRDLSEHWLGLTELTKYNGWFGPIRDKDQTIDAVVDAVKSYTPDLVIVGNLHGGKWPFEIITRLHNDAIPTIVYTHDFHHLTGGCVYPTTCTMLNTGCNDTCPSATDYPQIEPSLIADAHDLRRNAMSGPDPIPVAGNSAWVCNKARQSLGDQACLALLPLPIDTDLFSEIDRAVARRMLKVPGQAIVGVFGAVDMGNDHRKGLAFLPEVCEQLKKHAKCHLISFGKHSETLKHVRGFGMIADPRVMPLLYSASDFQMSFSAWETFGQTALEAASCSRPVVVRDSGGITQIAHHGVNATVVNPDTPEAFVEAVLELINDPDRRTQMGIEGRKLALANHSMQASCHTLERWLIALGDASDSSAGFGIPEQVHQLTIGGTP